MSLKLITGPTAHPVTLAEAKLHLRIDGSSDDAWIDLAIAAATRAAEHETGRCFITQTWEAVFDVFPDDAIELGLPPVQSIVSVKYIDAQGLLTTLDPAAYVLDSDQLPGYALPAVGTSWPAVANAANAVRVRFVAGYGDAGTAVPASVRHWILMHIGTAYKHRESVATGVSVAELVNRYHEALLDPLRVYRF